MGAQEKLVVEEQRRDLDALRQLREKEERLYAREEKEQEERRRRAKEAQRELVKQMAHDRLRKWEQARGLDERERLIHRRVLEEAGIRR